MNIYYIYILRNYNWQDDDMLDRISGLYYHINIRPDIQTNIKFDFINQNMVLILDGNEQSLSFGWFKAFV